MRRLWLIFAQAVTVGLAALFVASILWPRWFAPAPTPTPQSAPAPAATAMPVSGYADAVERAAPAVVNIYTERHEDIPLIPLPGDPGLDRLLRSLPGFTRRQSSTSLGSGVIVRPDGHILTNHHVIESADAIRVALRDGREAPARVVGTDPESDLAVLRIALDELPVVSFRAEPALRVGDVVLAIGNPFGVGQTTTMGIVSALGRSRLGINIYEDFIQTDAAINPGNSGGALIDAQGALVGINTAIYSETGGSLGIGFAIPATAAHHILDEIIAHGRVRRGWLGLEPQDVTPDLARAFRLREARGAIVARIVPGGPAATAGLRVGDIIRSVDGEPVRDAIELLNRVAPMAEGTTVRLGVLRSGREHEITLRIGNRPPYGRRGRR